jgi:natural product biosynthesis luciferase-like monooxygenase protein
MSPNRSGPPQFSLFFFSADGARVDDGKYDLILDCARLADEQGFCAVWTPERHFNSWGGLYPNPAVLGAAIAAQTARIGIRAGSVVLPLHDPIRVVEEWSVVDNLSRGRVSLSFASGWHKTDFVLRPDAYADRRERVESGITLVRRLWAGNPTEFIGVDGEPVEVVTYPRPIQRELPIWLTASSPETWSRAARLGANVLCLLDSSPGRLEGLVNTYRSARGEHLQEPGSGLVTVVVHAYVNEDLRMAREKVKVPLTQYLRTHIDQTELRGDPYIASQMQRRESEVLDFLFERRFQSSSLIGPTDKCCRLLEWLRAIGIDEVACLVDFGLEKHDVLDGIGRLAQLRQRYSATCV